MSGNFDLTVTIPGDHPTGQFELMVSAPPPQGSNELRWCSVDPYTVMAQFIIVPTTTTPTTTTTLGLAPPTTTGSPTTTMATTTTTSPTTTVPAVTTTVAAPGETTTPPGETTTLPPDAPHETTPGSADETTTTLAVGLDDNERDADAVGLIGDSGIPMWLLALVAVLALAVVALGGYVFGMRGRVPPPSAGGNEPGPAPPTQP